MAGQQDGFALGVDLGTSNTVAVLRWPDGRTRPVLVDGHPILPSGVYADADGHLHVGRDAQRLAQADPAGYEPNPKRRVDEETVELGGRAYRPAELLAATLRAVADAAVAAVGLLPPAVVTHPAAWTPARRQVLHDALELAGWPAAAEHTLAGPIAPGTRLLREPVAAARYFTQVLRRPVPVGGAVAVFDFGGGTLDVAVLRNEGADPWGDSGFQLVATGGIPDLGGLDLDAALLGRLGELVGPAHPREWARLTDPTTTAERRDRQQLWDNVRGAKEMLSRAMVAPVAVPGVEAAVPLSREDFERLAAPLLARAVTETREVTAAAGLRPEQLSGLFLVGGSTRVPLVARLLHAELGIAPTVLEQPEMPVAEGALTDLPLPRRSGRPAVPVQAAPAPPTPTQPESTRPAPAAGETAATVPAGGTRTNPTAPLGGPDAASAGPHGTLVADGPAPQTAATRYDGTPGPVPPQPTRYDHMPATHGPVPPHPAGYGVPGPSAPPPGGWQPGVPGTPFSPAPGGVRPGGGRPRRGRWIALGAGLVVVAVAASVLLWVFRDRHPALDFHTAELVKTVAAGDTRPDQMFTATLGERAYLARSLPDGHLHVTAVEAATGRTVWEKRTDATTQRWAGIRALPDGLLVLGDATGSDTPRVLAVLDEDSGDQRWRTDVGRDDTLYLGPDTIVRLDRTGERLVGLRLSDGGQRWERPNPRTEYGDARTKVVPVGTGAALDGPGNAEGSPLAPWAGQADRLVQVGADRSVRVLDMRSGKVLKDRGNVAGLDDPVAARDDRLYVAENERGLRLLAYDLGGLGTPSMLYEAPEQGGRVKDLVTCGERRVCLLETPGSGADDTRVVAATEGEGTRQWPAPRAESLVPVGEHVLAGQDSPDAVTLFAPDGTPVLRDRDGVAVRLDAGNLLIFSEAPSAYEDDRVLAGTAVDGKPVEMGQLKQIRSESCSWNTEMLVCGAEKEFRLYRFAG
ncbi:MULTISPECIES: Hsp70 family protein [unclassified Micromonospora]|uniref:Hsp70 family protein n=1 Tax=unclassified Micromonospora TaxID=2617518 RepID=UPI00188FA454|nr:MULTISPECIES: Hsp70 family protein [unclassified Micromonospora]MBF5033899.1 Hsp70 family protein [Micromonospora sp. ANENR4]MCZ7477071.1 Hsp70 family protein [Micromonospora sp. WMMC273]WBC01866.1 Hsp70 family protein [Micromonospora sp. WMMA1976]